MEKMYKILIIDDDDDAISNLEQGDSIEIFLEKERGKVFVLIQIGDGEPVYQDRKQKDISVFRDRIIFFEHFYI